MSSHLIKYKGSSWRFAALAVFFILFAGSVLVRVFLLAIVDHKHYAELAEKQHALLQELPSRRGRIFLQERNSVMRVAALDKDFYSLVFAPKNIPETRRDELVALAVQASGKKKEDFSALLKKMDDPYEVALKSLDENQARPIREAKISGVYLVAEPKRVYPAGTLAAQILGFVSYANEKGGNGAYGIEKEFEKDLAGERGFFEGDKDAAGYWIAVGRRFVKPAVDGSDIVLTVDFNIQAFLEEEIAKLVEKWGAESGMALALDPKTGNIISLASFPTFDPALYNKIKNYDVFRNPAVESSFELGSVFKPITMAAGIEEGVVAPDSTYIDAGSVKVGKTTIYNFDKKGRGVVTMATVLEKSLNTGAVHVVQLLGQERFKKFVSLFGFGEKTGIDLPGEVRGNILNLAEGRDVDFATASFGQGTAVTALQMASAFGALANGGVRMKPRIVEKIIEPSGSIREFPPEERGRPVSKETTEKITRMLVGAVRKGTYNAAGVDGYFVAAKTGTAQVPFKDKRGYSSDVTHTMIGYAPAFNPRFVLFIQLNKPRGIQFAATSMATPFHRIAKFILDYYEVPPDEAQN